MEFLEPPARTQLRNAVRAAVAHHATHARTREVMAAGFDLELWRVLGDELGVISILAGRDGSFADLAAVLEELGRGPVCAPVLGTAVLAPALARGCRGPVAEHVLAELARPGVRATAALERDTSAPEGGALVATPAGASLTVTGTVGFVVDAPGADLLLLPAVLAGEVAILAVDGNAAGLRCEGLSVMDQTRGAARLHLDAAPARCLAMGAEAAAAIATARHLARAALASEQVGGAAACLELSVAYAGQRRQFGVPIGSFQAVKHSCADMLVSVELARSAAQYAAWCADNDPDDLGTAALLAASLCAESYLSVAAATIQLHGGVGFTWDSYCHLYFKRAKSSALMFGQPVECRAELAALIGL